MRLNCCLLQQGSGGGNLYVLTQDSQAGDLNILVQLTTPPSPAQASLHTHKPTTHTQDQLTSTMKRSTSIFLSLAQLAAVVSALDTRADPQLDCYRFDAVVEHKNTFNSKGACSEECVGSGHSVIALRGPGCMCLDSLPSEDKKVDASECDEPCPGYVLQTCE